MLIETWLKTDIQKGVGVEVLRGNLFSGDVASNLIGVEVYDGDDPVTLEGQVQGYIVRGDGATVVLTNGTLSGNKASIALSRECYLIVGAISIVIKVGETTVGACHGYVYRTSTDSVVDPDHVIPSLSELLAQVEACRQAAIAATAATTAANSATTAANQAATNANDKAGLANTAATAANTAANKIDGMTASATGLAAGASPIATVTDVSGHKNVAFGIPKGDTGATPNLTIGTVTTLSEDASATATITGTAENPVLDLGIPRGRTGSASGVYASNTPMSSSDSTTIAEKIGTMDTGINNAVMVTTQTLTSAQKAQARLNINVPNASNVIMSTAQTLTDEQKTQARTNIGAASQAQVVKYVDVEYNTGIYVEIGDRTTVTITPTETSIDMTNATILAVILTYAWPLASWDNGAIVTINNFGINGTNIDLHLATTYTQNYRLHFRILYL